MNANSNALYSPNTTMVNYGDDGAFLGVESQSISKEKAEKLGFDNPHGCYVSKVLSNTAAEKAGLEPFDYIVAIDKHDFDHNTKLADILKIYEPGDKINLQIFRKGAPRTINLTLGTRADFKGDKNAKSAFLGISEASNSENSNGVTINVTGQNTTAKSMGLQNGDAVTAINGNKIVDWEDIKIAINNLEPGDAIEVAYEREGKVNTIKSNINSYDESQTKVYESPQPAPKPDYKEKEKAKAKEKAKDKVKEDGHEYAFLGVYTDELSREKAKKLGFDNPYGSYVTGILGNSAAEKAGIQVLDYIYGIDEYRVGENQGLTGILKKYKAGDKGEVRLVRQGNKTSVSAIFGNKSDAKEKEKKEKNKCESTFFGVTLVGNSHVGDDYGVKVNVVKNSTAKEVGLQNGDLILSLNNYRLVEWDDISLILAQLNPGDDISVKYIRDGNKMTGVKPIKSYAKTKNCKDCDCNEKYPKEKSWTNNSDEDEKGKVDRIDVENVSVVLVNMSLSECEKLTGDGFELAENNNVNVHNLSVEPNTKKGMFSLNFDLPENGETSVKVLNNKGRIIYDYDLGNYSGDFSDNVDLSQNGEGTYYLFILQDNKWDAKKIVLSTD